MIAKAKYATPSTKLDDNTLNIGHFTQQPQGPQLQQQPQQQQDEKENKALVPSSPTTTLYSRYNQNWAQIVQDIFAEKNKKFVLFLCSPPGAGKTYLTEKFLIPKAEAAGFVVSRVDGSSDQLVEVALQDILQQKFSSPAEKKLLVLDEFHMMTEDQKRHLMDWINVTKSLCILRVVLLTNRQFASDEELLLRVGTKVEVGSPLPANSGQLAVYSLLCRADVETISVQIIPKHSISNESLTFMKFWNRTSRMLFGPDILSLRLICILHDKIREQLKGGTIIQYGRSSPLGQLLFSKFPSLGKYTCELFTASFLHFWSNFTSSKPSDEWKNGPHLDIVNEGMHLLVATAWMDSEEDKPLCSFPEFVQRKSSEVTRYHPLARLAIWASYVHEARGVANEWKEKLNLIEEISVIDQFGFPQIRSKQGQIRKLTECEAVVVHGNYNNLKWMTDSITRGYAVNWEWVKRSWAENLVTDIEQFLQLLSICPDRASCLHSLIPRNLCSLIERSRNIFLATEVIDNFQPENKFSVHSCHHVAAWSIVRRFEPKEMAIIPQMAATLLWASHFSYHYSSVSSIIKDPVGQFRTLLLKESEKIVQMKKTSSEDYNTILTIDNTSLTVENLLVQLWNKSFASLFEIKKDRPEEFPTLFPIARLLAKSQYPPLPSWDETVRVLSRIYHKQAKDGEVNELFESQIGKEFFNLKYHPSDAKDSKQNLDCPYIPPEFAAGLLELDYLNASIQYTILTQDPPIEIPPEYWSTKNEKLLKRLSKGIDKLSQAPVTLFPIESRTAIETEYKTRQQASTQVIIDKQIAKIVKRSESQIFSHFSRYINKMTPGIDQEDKKVQILQFYNVYVGQNAMDLLDKLPEKNPDGNQFDLGRDGKFNDYKLLICILFNDEKEDMQKFYKMIETDVCSILVTKGFKFKIVTTQKEFIDNCDDYDVAWILSGSPPKNIADTKYDIPFVLKVGDFHRSGKGLAIMGENDPFTYHANIIFTTIFPSDNRQKQFQLSGEDIGRKDIKFGDDCRSEGVFGSHLLTSGIFVIHEGITICHPMTPEMYPLPPLNSNAPSSIPSTPCLHLLGTSNSGVNETKKLEKIPYKGKPVMMYADVSGDPHQPNGRLIIDCGYTKFFECKNPKYEGIPRYLSNLTVWLLGLDYKIGQSLNNWPLKHTRDMKKKAIDEKIYSHVVYRYYPTKKHVMLIIDRSSSMATHLENQVTRMDALNNAIDLFFQDYVKIDTNDIVTMVYFDEEVEIPFKRSDFQSGYNSFVGNKPEPYGKTNFTLAFSEAEKIFSEDCKDPLIRSQYMLFLTDGEDYTDSFNALQRMRSRFPDLNADFIMYGSSFGEEQLEKYARLFNKSCLKALTSKQIQATFATIFRKTIRGE